MELVGGTMGNSLVSQFISPGRQAGRQERKPAHNLAKRWMFIFKCHSVLRLIKAQPTYTVHMYIVARALQGAGCD